MGSRFRIVLDPPYSMEDRKSHGFLPGDRLSGKVVLVAKADEKIKEISINFKGSFYTKYTRANWYDEFRFNICDLSKTLLQGPTKLQASTYEYPFVLDIPTEFSSHAKHWEGFTKPGDLYSHSPGSPTWTTPPTVEDASVLKDSHSDWKITYTLTAQGKKSMLNLSDELPIRITCPPSINPGPGIFREDARDGFTQNVKLSNGSHRLDLSLLAQPTTAIISGKPFGIAFTLQGSSPELPEIRLVDYTINLCSSTTIGVPLVNSNSTKFESCSALAPFEFRPDKRVVNALLRLNEPVHRQETLPSRFHSSHVPSFKTLLLERRYYFQINVHVSCLGKTHKLKILLPFWLHPSDLKATPATNSAPLTASPQPPVAYYTSPTPTASHPNQHLSIAQHAPTPSIVSAVSPQSSGAGVPLANSSQKRFCGYCGTPIIPNARFCAQCGTQI